ncbi:hypothetical protein PYV02_11455 [Leifsonia sp. H3M29-4]|uniref:hypothetical protein n=1 Tax=Salinibacterium metalliresistens TaxID=3031321 RepID=UPI0023DC35AA|nr:hypothetical protein [Salinibacterium metalliresistens]MDF1479698.1 hypothetical protein [Salinibacterium metalliresistens]
MVVDKDSANWRLFGGGGLVVAGLLWLLGVILEVAGVVAVGGWIVIVALFVLGVALFLVAFGETGSNGAVGASVFGKVVLVAFGLGWILFGVISLLGALGIAAPTVLGVIAAVLVVVGGILSTFAIYQRGVARGIAKWVIALPVAWGILWIIHILGWVSLLSAAVLAGVLGALYAITGVLYLLNRKS